MADPRADLDVRHRLEIVVRCTGQTVEISAARPIVNVGRATENDIVLPSDNVSRRQMRFVFADGAVYAENLGSTCGTFIDGRELTSRTQLGRGAVVSFADFDIELVER